MDEHGRMDIETDKDIVTLWGDMVDANLAVSLAIEQLGRKAFEAGIDVDAFFADLAARSKTEDRVTMSWSGMVDSEG